MKNILIILVVLSLFTACGGTETEELAKKNKATIDSLQQIANKQFELLEKIRKDSIIQAEVILKARQDSIKQAELLAKKKVLEKALAKEKKDRLLALKEKKKKEKSGSFTDARDSKVYKWVRIGNQVWMAENLNYTGNNGYQRNITSNDEWKNNKKYDAWSYYDNNISNGEIYGVLYQWEAAKHACPKGWHLPSDNEWKELEIKLGMSNSEVRIGYRGTNEGSKLAGNNSLWESGELKNNSNFGTSGFSALPGGYRYYNYGGFRHLGYDSNWWSNTDHNSATVWYRKLDRIKGGVYCGINMKPGGFSVRCIRD